MKIALSVAAVACLAALALPSSAHAGLALFRAADTNGDGRLTRKEFPRFLRGVAAEGNRGAKIAVGLRLYGTAFRRTDLNGDGGVTYREVQTMERRNR